MLKKIHKVLIILMAIFFMATPSVVLSQEDTIPVARDISTNGETELIQKEVSVKDLDIEPIDTKKVKDTVVPDTAKEGKKVIGLFIKTMVAVILCALALYCVLLFIKKFYSHLFVNQDSGELENFDLSTPNNKNDALKSFLNRTK